MKNCKRNPVWGIIFATIWIVFGTTPSRGAERYRTLCDTTLTSTWLSAPKNITITVPKEWQQDLNQNFPLIIVFDRQNPRSHQFILSAIDYLSSTEQMPSAVIVSVESSQELRYRETVFPQTDSVSLLAANEAFLFKELIPLMEKKYKAGRFRMLIGHSRYGYFTTAMLCKHPKEINAVIALSPFLAERGVQLTDSLVALQQQAKTSVFYEYGIGNDYPQHYRQLTEALKNGHSTTFHAQGYYFPEADHNATPGLIINNALYHIFECWANMQHQYLTSERQDNGLLKSVEKNIAVHYEQPIRCSIGTLNGLGWSYYNDHRMDLAAAAWKRLVESYPNFAEGWLYIADALKQEGKDFTSELNNFDIALKSSGFYTAEEKAELEKERQALLK